MKLGRAESIHKVLTEKFGRAYQVEITLGELRELVRKEEKRKRSLPDDHT